MDNLQPYKISLDFYIRKIITVNAKQLDSDSRVINITCTENGKKFFVDSSTTSAFVRYKKSDGHAVLNQVDILSDGTVNLELTQQMLAVEGRHLVDIMLINKSELDVYMYNVTAKDDNNGNVNAYIDIVTEDDNEGNVTIIEHQTANVSDLSVEEILEAITENGISVLSTMSFYVNTEGVAIDGAEIESSYEYNALIEGLGKMVAVDNRMSTLEQTINTNETQRQTNEQARQETESERVIAETQRENKTNQAITDCEFATSNANTAIQNANNATIDAQTATENANNATNNANQATQNANTATQNANNAAQEVRNVLNNGGIVLKSDIVHNLETEDENKVPDATQVKILNEMIAKLQKKIDEMPEIHYGVGEPTSDIGKDGDIYMMIIEDTNTVEEGE